MEGTPRPEDISTRLQRVAELAKEAPELAFTTLAHHIDKEFLKEAFRRTRKNGAVGVDGQDAATYAENLDSNLENLLSRFKTGTYKAPPVKRVHIPKGDGKTRPIGIPCFEDKVLQRAVVMVLEAIYEQDFLDCSYGYRPERSAHQALRALWEGTMNMQGGWVIEVDIKDFFGNLQHSHLRSFLDQRVRDGVIRRTIDKWLAAGVLEDGRLSYSDGGSPQGGVASPVLSNIYLHEVMDKWFEHMVKPALRGQAFMIRLADDIVCVFEDERDARRVYEVLPKRFAKYGLELHELKTKLIDFRRPPRDGDNGTENFDFLGFTHQWALSLKKNWFVKKTTAKDRQRKAVKAIYQWCKENRHAPLRLQHQNLVLKLRGHYRYYGVTGNSKQIKGFFEQTKTAWLKWLSRRSHKGVLNWQKFLNILRHYPLPLPRIVHTS